MEFIDTNAQTMPIKWRLREMMAAKRWTNRALASQINLHETSVSRLKNQDTMPKIGSDTLSELCRVLECKPEDLLEYVPNETQSNNGNGHSHKN